MIGVVAQVVVDCREPGALADFWGRIVGGEVTHRDPGWSFVDPPAGVRIAFQRVPEGKATKNRLHLDITVDDVESAVREAVSAGASVPGTLQRDAQGAFQVVQDPEGNEFCFVS
ncbi:glyoxalase [Acrocarpospora phusangensis]|uniref:Glyoxalase n=1 Tax=Acrocarpospora phusangensis TaxID=1070424 RepID=A0A919QG89_9ACTN|nr:VOC family protein [Acrocarpospora phusangensis]GIH28238.1 glyoxalase [Acrocarpospora phusangensis]